MSKPPESNLPRLVNSHLHVYPGALHVRGIFIFHQLRPQNKDSRKKRKTQREEMNRTQNFFAEIMLAFILDDAHTSRGSHRACSFGVLKPLRTVRKPNWVITHKALKS